MTVVTKGSKQSYKEFDNLKVNETIDVETIKAETIDVETINISKLKDTNEVVRVEATTRGATTTGKANATEAAEDDDDLMRKGEADLEYKYKTGVWQLNQELSANQKFDLIFKSSETGNSRTGLIVTIAYRNAASENKIHSAIVTDTDVNTIKGVGDIEIEPLDAGDDYYVELKIGSIIDTKLLVRVEAISNDIDDDGLVKFDSQSSPYSSTVNPDVGQIDINTTNIETNLQLSLLAL